MLAALAPLSCLHRPGSAAAPSARCTQDAHAPRHQHLCPSALTLSARTTRFFLRLFPFSNQFFDDKYYSNGHYAQVAGVGLREWNAMELDLLFRLDFRRVLAGRRRWSLCCCGCWALWPIINTLRPRSHPSQLLTCCCCCDPPPACRARVDTAELAAALHEMGVLASGWAGHSQLLRAPTPLLAPAVCGALAPAAAPAVPEASEEASADTTASVAARLARASSNFSWPAAAPAAAAADEEEADELRACAASAPALPWVAASAAAAMAAATAEAAAEDAAQRTAPPRRAKKRCSMEAQHAAAHLLHGRPEERAGAFVEPSPA